jgi:hypothetical protein
MARVKYADCRVEGISNDSQGTVIVTVRFADGTVKSLPCKCELFLLRLERVGSDAFLRSLQGWRVDTWIESGVLVEMEALRPGGVLRRWRQLRSGDSRNTEDPHADDSRCTGIARSQREELQLLVETEAPWIYRSERKLLGSYIAQLGSGGPLTERQQGSVEMLQARVEKRKDPKFFRG